MKTIRLILLLASLAGLATLARAAEAVNVRGLLIAASQEPGESDPRLSSYVAHLRRIGRFESFRFLGDDSASISVPGRGELSLGGQGVQLATESADGKTVVLRVNWGSVSQPIVLQRGGNTTVMVGSPTGKKGENYVVLLIAR
jgi:hypothetical protein